MSSTETFSSDGIGLEVMLGNSSGSGVFNIVGSVSE